MTDILGVVVTTVVVGSTVVVVSRVVVTSGVVVARSVVVSAIVVVSVGEVVIFATIAVCSFGFFNQSIEVVPLFIRPLYLVTRLHLLYK